jgi:N-acetylneuraminate lyase
MPSPSRRRKPLTLRNLVAATFTPFRADGSVHFERIRPVIDHVIAQGASGLYVCGSTGEGPLLTTQERQAVALAHIQAAAQRVPVVIQVGHNSIEEARVLAAHAQRNGADAISATPPGYFKPDSMDSFIECMARIASGAPKLPFYYYHIPVLSGVRFDMVDFLQRAKDRIPNLRGIKFSDPNLHEMIACIEHDSGSFDILFGVDEMLLAGFAFGACGAVGSTFNFAAPLYLRIIEALSRGDVQEARKLQSLSAAMVRVIVGIGGRGGLKATMEMVGADCGHSRLPTQTCSKEQRAKIRAGLEKIGFFEFVRPR